MIGNLKIYTFGAYLFKRSVIKYHSWHPAPPGACLILSWMTVRFMDLSYLMTLKAKALKTKTLSLFFPFKSTVQELIAVGSFWHWNTCTERIDWNCCFNRLLIAWENSGQVDDLLQFQISGERVLWWLSFLVLPKWWSPFHWLKSDVQNTSWITSDWEDIYKRSLRFFFVRSFQVYNWP